MSEGQIDSSWIELEIVGIGFVFLCTYIFVIRPWILTWGATDTEVNQTLPGDDLVNPAKLISTRAITIEASAHDIWQWLMQIGSPPTVEWRDYLEALVASVRENAEEVSPIQSQLAVGDWVWISPHNRFKVTTVIPHQTLVFCGRINSLTGQDLEPNQELPDTYYLSSWAFILSPLDQNSTRLITRERTDYNPSVVNELSLRVLFDPIHFMSERKMLQTLKQQVEAAT